MRQLFTAIEGLSTIAMQSTIAEQQRRHDSRLKTQNDRQKLHLAQVRKQSEKAMQEVEDLKQTVKQMQNGKQAKRKKLIVKKQKKCSAPVKPIRRPDDRDSYDQDGNGSGNATAV